VKSIVYTDSNDTITRYIVSALYSIGYERTCQNRLRIFLTTTSINNMGGATFQRRFGKNLIKMQALSPPRCDQACETLELKAHRQPKLPRPWAVLPSDFWKSRKYLYSPKLGPKIDDSSSKIKRGSAYSGWAIMPMGVRGISTVLDHSLIFQWTY